MSPLTSQEIPMRPFRTVLKATATAVVACLTVGGCNAYDLPLPGGAGAGEDAYTVTAEFSDVLDLVPQS
jgi:phospholipid/cholesterol/gamma-HCH transport system substrate-binding protein